MSIVFDFRNKFEPIVGLKTKPLTILANEAEETTRLAEVNLAEFILVLQGYFRAQEDNFTDYFVEHTEELSKIKPVNPDNLTGDDKPDNKKLIKFIDKYNWREKKDDLNAILNYIIQTTAPSGIENAVVLINRIAKIKEKREKVSLGTTVEYVNSAQFSADAQSYITLRTQYFGYERDEISKNIDAQTSELIYKQLYEGVENLEGMSDLAVRVSDVFDDCTQSRALTVARTETLRAFNSATIHSYEVAEIEEAQFLIANDERTCDMCLTLSGLIVPVSEAANYLPLHPRCRCTWIAVIGKPLLSKPSEEDLEYFIEKYPNISITRSRAMPTLPERGHLEHMSHKDAVDRLLKEAKVKGIELDRDTAELMTMNVRSFSGTDYVDIRSVQRKYLESGKIGLYRKEEIKNIEKFIELSPNYSKDELLFRGINITRSEAGYRGELNYLKTLTKGDIINMGGTSSWTSSAYTMKEFSAYGDDAIGFVLKGGSNQCASVTHLSAFAKEQEVIISMNSKFKAVQEPIYGSIDKVFSKSEIKKLMKESLVEMPIKGFIKAVGERNWIILGEI